MSQRQSGPAELNLFPFMSVLISLKGVMMFFLIAIVSTRAMVFEEKPSEPPPPPPPPRVAVEGPLDDEEPLAPDAPRLPDKEYAGALREIQQLTARLAQRERDCQELLEVCEQFREAIKMEEEQLAMPQLPSDRIEGAPLGALEKVSVVPDPRAKLSQKASVIVEIQPDLFVVHPEKTEYPVTQLPVASSPLRKFLDVVDKQRSEKYLLVVVHPGGVPTYEKLRKCLLHDYSESIRKDVIPGLTYMLITKSRIDIGVEPFRRDWLYVAEEAAGGKAK